MKRFTNAGRQAIKDGNLYAALSLALTLPDVCSSLERPGPSKPQKRYKRWCERWLVPKFTRGKNPLTGQPIIFVRAEDIFQSKAPRKRRSPRRFLAQHRCRVHAPRRRGLRHRPASAPDKR